MDAFGAEIHASQIQRKQLGVFMLKVHCRSRILELDRAASSLEALRTVDKDVGVDGEALRVWCFANQNVEGATEVVPSRRESISDLVIDCSEQGSYLAAFVGDESSDML
jgi:hypothetical protein